VRAELSSRLGWQHASARDFRWRCARTHAFLRRASILAVGSSPQLHVYIGCGHRAPVAAERGTRRRGCYHRAYKYTWRLALAETAQRDRRRCAARRCGHRGEPWPSKAMLRHGGFSRPRGGLATPFAGGAGRRRRGRARRKNARGPHAAWDRLANTRHGGLRTTPTAGTASPCAPLQCGLWTLSVCAAGAHAGGTSVPCRLVSRAGLRWQ
jgi:hypothetical protein